MPIFEYKCNDCGKNFEQIVFPSDNESNLKCTSCDGNNINRLVSSFSCGSSGKSGDIDNFASTGCSPSGGFS